MGSRGLSQNEILGSHGMGTHDSSDVLCADTNSKLETLPDGSLQMISKVLVVIHSSVINVTDPMSLSVGKNVVRNGSRTNGGGFEGVRESDGCPWAPDRNIGRAVVGSSFNIPPDNRGECWCIILGSQ